MFLKSCRMESNQQVFFLEIIASLFLNFFAAESFDLLYLINSSTAEVINMLRVFTQLPNSDS